MASKAPPPVSAGPSTPLLPSSARRQPMRQARTNPARKNAANPKLAGNSRLQNGTGSHSGHPTPSTQPPAKFYPALTAFTDAVDALPSETIRHFTLLREVDAKAYGPEAILRSLITAAQELPPPDDPYEFDPALEAMKQLDDLQRRREELVTPAEAMLLHELEATQSVEIASGARTILGHPETRRSRCHQIRTQITEILVTLDEKIHVITTAYEALQKHLQRIDHAYSYVQHEIPDVYRLGSTEHWAYKEPVKKGTAAAQARAAERAQREAEERHAAAQQRELETSNTRSETRREALLRQKAAAQQAAATASVNEEDEQAPREQNHAQPAKKLHGNSKLRKEQEAALASAKRMAEHQSANGVGGGLIPAAAATAAATTATAATAATTPLVPPQQKRRKTTNTTKETPTADKVSAPGTANKGAVSPRAGTPASTASKRGGKSGSGTGAGRGGRRNGPGPVTAGHTSTTSPHLGSASSPIHALFPPVKTKKEKDVVVDDPAAIAASASASAAAVSTPLPVAPRRNSKVTGTAPGADAFRDERPPTNADIVMGGTSTEAPLPPPPQQSSTTSAKAPDSQFLPPPEKPKRKKDLHHSITVASHNNPDEMQGVEPTDPHPRPQQQQPHSQSHTHGRKDSTDNKKDDKKRKRHDDHHNPASTATTDAAAASTAATSTTTEKPTKSHSAKARPSTSDGLQHPSSSSTTGNSKRGNRKRADSSAAALMKVEEPEEPEEPVDEDADADAEDDADEDEPRYCICNQVSYGEMVACDGDACKKEWFHLDCVGLQTAPKGKAKWYCEDCLKESISRGRRTGSRA